MRQSPRPSESRRQLAAERAQLVCRELMGIGVKAKVIGSLATGRFGIGSDIDFLIEECPHQLKYTIESMVEDCLAGIPFDVLYRDEIPEWRLPALLNEAVDAAVLG